jgi:hypothetical protein
MRSYRLRPPTGSGLAHYEVDGVCSDAEYRHAASIPFPSPDVPVVDGAVNETDNSADCRLVWQSGDPTTIQGCCRVQDTYLVASTAADDPPHHLHGGGDAPPDDRLEMGFSPNLEPTNIGGSVSVEMNNREGSGGESPGGRPTYQDVRWLDGGGFDASTDWVTKARVARTDGLEYTLEWRAELPFDVTAGGTHLCNAVITDVDRFEREDGERAERRGAMAPFANEANFDDFRTWGCCFFE